MRKTPWTKLAIPAGIIIAIAGVATKAVLTPGPLWKTTETWPLEDMRVRRPGQTESVPLEAISRERFIEKGHYLDIGRDWRGTFKHNKIGIEELSPEEQINRVSRVMTQGKLFIEFINETLNAGKFIPKRNIKTLLNDRREIKVNLEELARKLRELREAQEQSQEGKESSKASVVAPPAKIAMVEAVPAALTTQSLTI